MSACIKCGILQAIDDELCPLCGLVRALRQEHVSGAHSHMNESCATCIRIERTRRKAATQEYNETIGISHRDCTHPHTQSARTVCREHRRIEEGLSRKLNEPESLVDLISQQLRRKGK